MGQVLKGCLPRVTRRPYLKLDKTQNRLFSGGFVFCNTPTKKRVKFSVVPRSYSALFCGSTTSLKLSRFRADRN